MAMVGPKGEERVCLDGKMEIVNRPKETCPDFRPFCCQWKEPGTSGSIKCSASKDDCTPWKKKVSTAVPATTTTKTTGADLGDVCYSLEAGPDPCKAGLKCGDPKYDNVPDATKKCVRIEDDGTVTTGASFYKSCQDGDLEYEHGTRFGTIGTTCNDYMKTFQGEEKVCIDGKFQTVKRQAQACQRFRPYCCQKGQPGKSGSVMCSASKDSCTSWKQKGLRIKASEHRDNALPKHSLAGAIGLSGAVAAVMLFAF